MASDASRGLPNAAQLAPPPYWAVGPPTEMILIITSGRSSTIRSVKADLESEGLSTGETGAWTSLPNTSSQIDLVIFDPTESDGEPTSVLHELRARYRAPILVVSRRLELEQRISLLEGGADQVIEAPYHPHELLARIHAIMRRRSFFAE